jgi:hypothetical protein
MLIDVYRNDELGLAVFIWEEPKRGIVAALCDTDARETLAIKHGYKTMDAAVADARKFIDDPNAQPTRPKTNRKWVLTRR